MVTLASFRHVVVNTIPEVKEESSKDPKMLVYGPSPYSGYNIHPVWFITDTSNFRLVCPLEFPYMIHATSQIYSL